MAIALSDDVKQLLDGPNFAHQGRVALIVDVEMACFTKLAFEHTPGK